MDASSFCARHRRQPRPALIAQGYPAPTLSREAGEGVSCPRPFGVRGKPSLLQSSVKLGSGKGA